MESMTLREAAIKVAEDLMSQKDLSWSDFDKEKFMQLVENGYGSYFPDGRIYMPELDGWLFRSRESIGIYLTDSRK